MTPTLYHTVVGIDPSLTSTGLAVVHRHGTTGTWTVKTKGRRDDSPAARVARIRHIRGEIADVLTSQRDLLVVLEAPATSRGAGAGHVDLWWLWGRIVETCVDHEADLAIVYPSTRAAWATGNGKADKRAVVDAMRQLVPGIDGDDEADAAALALMGAQALGWRTHLDAEPHRRRAVRTVAWPPDVADQVIARLRAGGRR